MSATCKMLRSTDGTEIYADATGDPQHPGIVFVHGMTLSGAVFDGFFTNKRLSERFYLVRYDMRGHGRSGKPDTREGHSSSLYADDFTTVVRAFGLEKPLYVGWSLGAAIIADICINLHPLPIRGAIALGGPPLFHLDMVPVAFTPLSVSLRQSVVSADTPVALAGRRDFVDACFYDAERVPFPLRFSWVGYSVLHTPHMVELVSRRQQDTARLLDMKRGDLRFLMLYGSKDKLVNGAAIAKELVRGRYFGGVEIETKEIDGGSHSVFLDNVEETVDAVIGFAESI